MRQFLEAMPREDVEDVFSSAYMQNKRSEVRLFTVMSGGSLLLMINDTVQNVGLLVLMCPSLCTDPLYVSE